MATRDAGTVRTKFDGDTGGLKRADAAVAQSANRMAGNFSRARKAAARFRGTVGRLSSALTSLRTVGALVAGGFAAGQLGNFTKAGAAMYELSLRTGATVSELERLKLGLQADGAEIDKVTRVIGILSTRIDEAAEGTAEYADLFRRLNLDAGNLRLRSLTGQFRELANALSDLTEAGRHLEAVGIARQLLGERGINQIVALFERGRLDRNIRATGHIPVVTTREAERIKEVEQAFTDLRNQIKNRLLITLSDLDEGLKGTANFLETHLPIWTRAIIGQLPETGERAAQGAAIAAGAYGASKAGQFTTEFGKLITALRSRAWTQAGTAGGRAAGLAAMVALIAFAVEQWIDVSDRIEVETERAKVLDLTQWGNSAAEQVVNLRAALEALELEIEDMERGFTPGGSFGPAGGLGLTRFVHGVLGAADALPPEDRLAAYRSRADELRELLKRATDAVEVIPPQPPPPRPLLADIRRPTTEPTDLGAYGLTRSYIGRTGPRRILDNASISAMRDILAEVSKDMDRQQAVSTAAFRQTELALAKREERIESFAQDAAASFEELVFSIDRDLSNLGDALRGFFNDLARSVFRQVVTEPLGDVISGFIGKRAGGGYARGLTLVGEVGPELVDFRSPAQVYSSQQLGRALAGGGGSSITINFAPEVSAMDADGVQDALREAERNLETLIRQVMVEQSQRAGPTRRALVGR